MINIIWSDDQFHDLNHKKATIENCINSNIKLSAYTTWEETRNELVSHGAIYDVIILDGKGQREVDSPSGDSRHLSEAMTWLSEQNALGNQYQIIVYTGFYENINEVWAGNKNIAKIIEKTDWEELKSTIESLSKDKENFRLRSLYSKSWKIFSNDFLNSKTESKLLKLVKKMESRTSDKTDFNLIREILEDLLLKFNEIDDSESFLPNDVVNDNNGVNFDWSLRILKGMRTEIKHKSRIVRVIQTNFNPVIPKKHYIGYAFDFVKETSSALSHTVNYSFNSEIFEATLKALLEILSWSNELLEKKLTN